MKTSDFLIVGSGPGGYIGAIRAAQLGYSVGLVEREDTLGGVCLNWGCIPTKSLLKSAELFRKVSNAKDFGINVKGHVTADIADIVKHSRSAVAQLGRGVAALMKKYGVTVHHGHAKLLGSDGRVLVEQGDDQQEIICAKHIILATGARARTLGNFDQSLLWTARDAMTPLELPKSLLIIGSGAIGIEFASFYSSLGCSVTIVELLDRILPQEDREISEYMLSILSKKGINILTKHSLKELQRDGSLMRATITSSDGANSTEIECEKAIVAVGVIPNSEDLGLNCTAVKLDKNGFIETDDFCMTAEPGVYAIGDVAGPPCLAHKASHEAVCCVEHIAHKDGKLTRKPLSAKNIIPSCTYSSPQVASVGLSEERARELGFEIRVGTSHAYSNGKALVSGLTDEFVKVVICASTGAILGAHLIGENATEMINGFIVGMQNEMTDLDIAYSIFPHPTLSEMMHSAVLSALGAPLDS